MNKKLTFEWLYAASIRSLRTMAQTALGMLSIGLAVNEVNWMHVLSVAFVSGVYSILTSLATNLPEVGSDGVLKINTSGEKDVYLLEFNNDLSNLADKQHVTFKIDSSSSISQE
jgi:hypothetical protein